MIHGGAATRHIQDTLDLDVNIEMNLAWLLPLGFTLGALVVVAFDYKTLGWKLGARRARFKQLIRQENDNDDNDKLPPSVNERLARWVDGPTTMAAFWGGAVLRPESKDVCAKNYEVLAVLQALLFSVSVAFYVESSTSDMLGTACCLGCCAFWMGTLSSAFLSVTITTVDTEREFAVLIGLYGETLMAVPMMLLVWGSLMIFLQLILFFKTQVDANVSYICLAVCFLVAPLFFHAMHKLSWVHQVIKADADVGKQEARSLTPEEIQSRLVLYVESKTSFLDLDRQEFLSSLRGRRIKCTSAQQVYAGRLFDEYLETQLAQIRPLASKQFV